MPLFNRRQLLISAVGSAAVAAPLASLSQEAPLRIVVGFPAGGGADRLARMVSEPLQAALGRPVIVENRPGAGGRLAAQQLVNLPSSQTVLMLGNPAVMSVAPVLYKNLSYDVHRDFVAVAGGVGGALAIAVGAGLGVKELQQLLAWIRANPDKANAGVPATASLPHFFALMLSQAARVNIEVVGYRGSAQLTTDLIGGQIPFAVDTLDALLPPHDLGQVRILATSGAQRSPLSPQLPTFKEQGLPLAGAGWVHFFAPSTTSPQMVERLGSTLKKIMAEPKMREKLFAARLVPQPMGPAETAASVQAFDTLWQPVIARSGIRPDA